MLAKAKRKRGKSRAGKEPQSKRFRGAVENRTCPHCKREFTSELGRNYHVSKFERIEIDILGIVSPI
jgi:hypothetical protein